jgi:hypothetical protein
MSDAPAANTSMEKNVIRAYCLAHTGRNDFELREDYSAECAVVPDAVDKLCGYEAETAGMNSEKNSMFFKTEHGAAVGCSGFADPDLPIEWRQCLGLQKSQIYPSASSGGMNLARREATRSAVDSPTARS